MPTKNISPKIGIIDYEMGNLHSVKKAIEYYGGKVCIIKSPKQIIKVDKIILPGVGAFGDAIKNLKKLNLYPALKEYLMKDKILLGICLGMQILFEKSYEAEGIKGLGVLRGRVVSFNPKNNLKVPHMGWNKLIIKNRACPLLKGLGDNPYVYFCHSFYPEPKDKKIICATTYYSKEFAAVVQQKNTYGLQFHPEKSQKVGLKIIKNFLDL